MRACLRITAGEGSPVVCELSPGRSVLLGRHRANTIVVQDRHASRRHAEVFAADNSWFIRDCETLNGTRVNGQRIEQPTLLPHGAEIGIGAVRLRFTLESADHAVTQVPPHPARGKHHDTVASAGDESGSEAKTALEADELSSLCTFMTAAIEEASPRALIERALTLVHSHTWASITGFLNLDPEDPLPKIVLPQMANVDVHLSRRLTQQIQSEGRLVRLGGDTLPDGEEESLLAYSDALCVPLCAPPAGGHSGNERRATALGALHVYKASGSFSDRQVRFCEVLGGYLANSLAVLRARRTLEAENSRLRAHAAAGDEELLGDSTVLQTLREHIGRVAPRPCSVLIVGESGVGKELVALALHRGSSRCDGPLVTVNCAAIAASLPEGELFGHCEGGFTGANCDRPGYFQQADEGTLFLDEIGELSLECQAKLLRVIEGKSFRPVGATAEVRVDVRILAATHRNLEEMVREGRFRQDLYFRLGVPIKVPPLRQHAEDIPILAKHFVQRLAWEYKRPLRLTADALARLQAFPWPGNVRQLRSVLENAVAMTDEEVLDAHNLPLPDASLASPGRQAPEGPGSLNLEQVERWAIRQALKQTGGKLQAAADLLGIHRDTLRVKMDRYGIKRTEE